MPGYRVGRLVAASAILAGAAWIGDARADTAAQQLSLLQEFNLIDAGNLLTSSEIEGRAFVGGNETGQLSNIGFNGGLTASPDGYATLTVDGSVLGGANVQTGNVAVGGSLANTNLNNSGGTVSQVGGNVANVNVNGGTLQYGGSKFGYVNANGGASVQSVPGIAPGIAPSTFDRLGTLSATLDSQAANSHVTISQNTAIFNAVANANGQAIFDVSAAVFGVGQFQFNMNGATSAIINVDGGGLVFDNANFLGGQAQSLAHELLWNFNSTSNLAIGAEFGGTVLAENATVINTASIDGTLVAGQLTQFGELHSYDYQGSLPSTPAAIPEPPAALIFGTALLGLAAALGFRRSRRQH